MENQQEEIQENGLTLSQEIEFNGIINLIKTFVPNLAQYLPILENYLEQGQQKADEYLGDNKKTIVAFRVGGRSRVVVIDSTKSFTISYNAETKEKKFELAPEAIIENYDVRQFIQQKALGSPKVKYFLDIMREEYNEKFKDAPPAELPQMDFSNLLNKFNM